MQGIDNRSAAIVRCGESACGGKQSLHGESEILFDKFGLFLGAELLGGSFKNELLTGLVKLSAAQGL